VKLIPHGSEAFASLLSELVCLNICKRIRSKTATYYQHPNNF
jgi:hypothetical protein